MDSPLELMVYDRNFKRLQEVADPLSVSLTPRFNAQGTGELIVGADDPINEYLLEPGARLVCRYKDEHLMSGRLRSPRGSLTSDGSVIFQIQDDWRILANTLGHIRPGGAIEAGSTLDLAQAWRVAPGASGTVAGQAGYFQWPEGLTSPEAAIHHVIERNLQARLDRPVVLGPNLQRGGDALAAGLLRNDKIRNAYLDEIIAPLLEFSGLGLRVRQLPGDRHLTIDLWEPIVWPHVLDHESGIVTAGEWLREDAEATRVLAGGAGEGPARAFLEEIDVELELEENDVIEVFKDATSEQIEWPDTVPEDYRVPKYYAQRDELTAGAKAAFRGQLLAAAREALAEGRRKSGVSIELAETEAFYLGGDGGIHLGDEVPIAIAGGATITDRLTAATFTLSDEGFTVTPQVGNAPADEDEALWRVIDALAGANRNLATRR